MYRITHTPTGEVIAIATTWQDAAATLRRHADTHDDDTYNAVTADPSVILHLSSMGDSAYIITRDEGDLRDCSHCDRIGIVTNQSDGYPLSAGSWSIACCADCATEWETTYPDEPSDYRADDIRRIVTARTRIDGLRHIDDESSGFGYGLRHIATESERDAHETARISTPPHAYIATPDNLETGQRVIFTRNVTRYPFVIINKGETGSVTEVSADAISVTLDTRHVGLDEWDNALQVCIPSHDIDDTDALSVI